MFWAQTFREMELALPMYNVHPYFSLPNLGRKVRIIHDKIQYVR